jgi:hypothetical protein
MASFWESVLTLLLCYHSPESSVVLISPSNSSEEEMCVSMNLNDLKRLFRNIPRVTSVYDSLPILILNIVSGQTHHNFQARTSPLVPCCHISLSTHGLEQMRTEF